jgi:hypothetical protein
MCPLTLFHEISQHYVRALRVSPITFSTKKVITKRPSGAPPGFGGAGVEQREHHELGEERYKPRNRAPKALQGERRERCEDRPKRSSRWMQRSRAERPDLADYIAGLSEIAGRDNFVTAGSTRPPSRPLGFLVHADCVGSPCERHSPTAQIQPPQHSPSAELAIFVAVQRSAGDDPRRWSRRSWIAFLGGLGLLAAGLIAAGSFPVISTVAALVGIAAMIYGVVAGVMVVFNRDNDGPPD